MTSCETDPVATSRRGWLQYSLRWLVWSIQSLVATYSLLGRPAVSAEVDGGTELAVNNGGEAAELTGRTRDDHASLSLVTQVSGEDHDKALRVSIGLLQDHTELVADVIKGVNKKEYAARKRATWALTGAMLVVDRKRRGDCERTLRGLLPNLIEIARDRDAVDRGSAGAWMGILFGGKGSSDDDRQQVVSALTSLLRDREWYTRWKAVEGAMRMGPAGKSLVPALAERLDEPEPHIRRAACVALGGMGPAAKAAIPELRNFSEDPGLRDLVRDAIQRIDRGDNEGVK